MQDFVPDFVPTDVKFRDISTFSRQLVAPCTDSDMQVNLKKLTDRLISLTDGPTFDTSDLCDANIHLSTAELWFNARQ